MVTAEQLTRCTPRELQVFMLLGSGLRVTDIGRTLNISVKTVATYGERLRGKLKIPTATMLSYEAIAYAKAHPVTVAEDGAGGDRGATGTQADAPSGMQQSERGPS